MSANEGYIIKEYPPSAIVAIGIALPLIAVVAVALRLLVRLKIQPTYLGPDDWLAVAAVILAVADGANLVVEAVIGDLGRVYQDKIPDDRYTVWGKSDYAQVIIEKPLYAMMKLSALFFYRRIFKVHRRFRMFNTFMIAATILWAAVFMFAEIFTCGIHPEKEWTPGQTREGCLDETWLNLAFAITDALGDILVVSMPFPCIVKLRVTGREKIGLVIIFALAYLSTASSIVRLGFIGKAWTQNFSGGGNDHGSSTAPSVWSTIEGSLGVTAACLPPLGAIWRKGFISGGLLPKYPKGSRPIFSERDGLTVTRTATASAPPGVSRKTSRAEIGYEDQDGTKELSRETSEGDISTSVA